MRNLEWPIHFNTFVAVYVTEIIAETSLSSMLELIIAIVNHGYISSFKLNGV